MNSKSASNRGESCPIIAIDGPAASGKSTVGDGVARRLGFLFFDTGAMYRAVTYAAHTRHIAIEDEGRVSALAEQLHIDVVPSTVDDGRQYTVLVDAEDVTWALRSSVVDTYVSMVSAYPRVRTALTKQQHRIAQQGNVVMVGRDIGTVVYPEAPLKIYLDASPEIRASRRHKESLARSQPADYQAILSGVLARDEIDSSRKTAPLRIAGDAVVLDTDQHTVAEVIDRVVALAEPFLPHPVEQSGC
ncbi:MAG: (d)CMP kinase [Chloroflexi bacterium]|nr:(d)CMP kinase [Chloroflexota bacterium]